MHILVEYDISSRLLTQTNVSANLMHVIYTAKTFIAHFDLQLDSSLWPSVSLIDNFIAPVILEFPETSRFKIDLWKWKTLRIYRPETHIFFALPYKLWFDLPAVDIHNCAIIISI